MGMGYGTGKEEAKKTKFYVVQISVKQVERTDGTETERKVRDITHNVYTGDSLKRMFKTARDILFVVEEMESADSPGRSATSDVSTNSSGLGSTPS